MVTYNLQKPKNLKPAKPSRVQLSITEDAVRISGIPKNHTLELVATSNYDKFYVIHGIRENGSYRQINLHIGHQRCLTEVQITKLIPEKLFFVVRYELHRKPGSFRFSPDPKIGVSPTDVYNGLPIRLETISLERRVE